jgi:MFS family permease
MGFVQVHLIAHVSDLGFAHVTNASEQFILALLSIGGALLAGSVSDRIGRRRPMSMAFAGRGLAYLVLVLLAGWRTPVILYAAVILMGLSWTSTISLLASTCADLYGRRSQGSVFGLVFGVMFWGATFGGWLPGPLYDYTGTYQSALWLSVLVAWVAGGLILRFREWWMLPQRMPTPGC